MFLRQSTSQIIRFGPFLDSTDGVTPETGLTIAQADMQLSKDGSAFAQKNAAGNATHDTDGWYSTTLNTTDTATTGELKIQVNVSGALPVWEKWFVLTQSAYDSLQTGTFNNVAATDIVSAGAINTLSGAVVNVDLVDTTTSNADMRGTDSANTVVPPSVAQFNARTILSAAYFDPATDTVANVALVATTTTNTDMVGTNNALLTASYTAPDNAGITQIQVDISNLNDITAADVWSSVTRTLTSGVNIVLAKGVGVTGFNDIAATDIVTSGAITTSAGNANVNVVKINGTNVIGAGTAGNLWRA